MNTWFRVSLPACLSVCEGFLLSLLSPLSSRATQQTSFSRDSVPPAPPPAPPRAATLSFSSLLRFAWTTDIQAAVPSTCIFSIECESVCVRQRLCVRVRAPAAGLSVFFLPRHPSSLFGHDAGIDPLPGRVSADPEPAAAATPDYLRGDPFGAGRLRGHQVHEGTEPPFFLPLSPPPLLPHFPSDLLARLLMHLLPSCMYFFSGLFCAHTAVRICSQYASVGLYFCFGCTCSTRHMPPPPPYKTILYV